MTFASKLSIIDISKKGHQPMTDTEKDMDNFSKYIIILNLKIIIN